MRLWAVLHPPRGAVATGLRRAEQIEEGHRVEGLGPAHTGAPPHSCREKLKCHNGIDRRLPHHTLHAVLAHGPLVVDHVLEVDLARLAVLARAGHPETCAGLAGHAWADRGWIRQAGRHHVPRGDLYAAN